MSRIGKLPINLPGSVQVTQQDGEVTVKGPKGSLSRRLHPDMIINVSDSVLQVERPSDGKTHRALHGLTRSLLSNMVEGVTNGYTKVLEIQGVGFRAQLAGPKLQMQLGFSHPVEVTPRPGISFEVGQEGSSRTPTITVSGLDKETVGQQAAEIRALKKPEPYKGKGIRYKGEQVRRKAGKSGGKAGAKK